MSRKDATVESLLAQPNWNAERKAMRALLRSCDMVEQVKWGQLCYTHDGGNVAIIACLKDHCGIGFFKGALFADPDGLLHRQGENSQSSRIIRFRSVRDIAAREDAVRGFVAEAIENEKAGRTVDFKARHELVFPDELVTAFGEDTALREAFMALTPGRQRGYNLHFTGAKQSATRRNRIAKYRDKIIAGKGIQER